MDNGKLIVRRIGNCFILLSGGALIYSLFSFTNSHPFQASILTLDSAVLLLCSIGLRQFWRWTVLVFTLFLLNLALVYFLTLRAGLSNELVYVTVAAIIIGVYYFTTFRYWALFK